MNRRRQSGGAMPSKKMPGRSYPKGLKPTPAGRKKPAPMPPAGKKKKRPMPPKGYQKGGAKDLKNIGIEESKEVKFGKPDIPKSDYSNAKTVMRSKSGKKDTSGMFKPKGSSTGKRYKAQGGAFAERVTRDRERAAGIDNSSLTSAGFSKPKSKSKVGEGTVLKPQDEKPKKKANPYADAKKRDPQLDSYIKQRNAAEKGSSAYNEAQNKINRAYGKGPIRKVEPIKKAAPKKAAPVENKSAPKPKLQTKPKPTPPPAPKSKKEQRTDRRVGRIEERREKREDKAADRSFARNERKGARADKKQGRMDRRDRIRVAKGKKPKQGFDPSKATSSPPYNEKKKYGGTRKKAQAGAAVQAGGAVLGGIGKLTDAIAGRETKFGKIAGAVGQTAGAVGGMMGGIPGGVPGGQAGGQAPPPAPNQPQPQAQAQPQPQPQAQGADEAVEKAANQPMKNGGKKRKQMGGAKMKPKSKKMKYQKGGAKPDYLDMDKDGNKTEPMKSALKDRRKRRGGRR